MLKRPLKLLFVENHYDTFFTHRLGLAEASQQAGLDVHVALPHPSGSGIFDPTQTIESHFKHSQLTFHFIPITRKEMAPWSEMRTILSLFSLYRRLRPDIVHHIRFKAIMYGGLVARVLRVPAVVNAVTGLGYAFTARGWRASVVRFVVVNTFRVAFAHRNQLVIFQNPDDCRLLINAGVCSERDSVVIKGAGVDISMFTPSPEPFGIPVVLMPSRMLWNKGVADFVDAARQLINAGARARFILVGGPDPGNPGSIPASQLQEWNDTNVVEWWGWRQDMKHVFSESNIVCLPSTYGEGVPKALIEAAACGRALVTTDTAGCREICHHGVNGFLIPPRNIAALAESIHTLLADADLRQRFARKSRSIAVADFSQDRVTADTCAVYRALLSVSGLDQKFPGGLRKAAF